MKNPKDYEAGYTTRIFNKVTGKYSSGAAARNHRMANNGGLSAMEEKAFISGAMFLQPLVDGYKKQLHEYENLLSKAAQIINAQNKIKKY